jgi:beta-lactamase superfamily II metal-dependent hydrolase
MLKIHFLNVGHGDCTVIEHPSGRLTVIDINNGDELDPTTEAELSERYHVDRTTFGAYFSGVGPLLEQAGYDVKLTNPIEFLTGNFQRKEIWRYVQTHPDLDHMRGLCALTNQFTINNLWDVPHSKTINEFLRESDRDDWAAYQRLRKGEGATVLQLTRGRVGTYWNRGNTSADAGDGIEILAPTPEIIHAAGDDTNCMSYVLRLTYAGIKIILGGDADEVVWEDIYRHYGSDLKCHVLKASHHGRDSGYHQPSVEAMAPQYTIVSVGKKPDTDASNKYRQYSSEGVWSTRWYGNITLTIDPNGRGNLIKEYVRENVNAAA